MYNEDLVYAYIETIIQENHYGNFDLILSHLRKHKMDQEIHYPRICTGYSAHSI